MNRIFKFVMTLSIFSIMFSACKMQQQVAEISGQNIRATDDAPDIVVRPKSTPIATPPPVAIIDASLAKPIAKDQEKPITPIEISQYNAAMDVPEVTRRETFKLADGESAANGESLKYKYHVVVGSFGIQDNAKKLQADLLAGGDKPVIVVNEQGMFRLLISSYNEYLQARERINQINTRFKDAWVLVQKQ